MSAHYHDAGSGPHDPESRTNDKGERNCGCRHDGLHWATLCQAARNAYQTQHDNAQLNYMFPGEEL